MAPPEVDEKIVEEAPPSDTTEPDTKVIHKNVKRKWVSYLWDTFDKSPEERKLLFKLDTALLTFASFGKYMNICTIVL